MFFDLKSMLDFNFYFFKFCKKTKNNFLKTKVVKQKLKKIFQHVFSVKKHVELKFLKFIKHVKIILQILIKSKQHLETEGFKFVDTVHKMFIKIIYFER